MQCERHPWPARPTRRESSGARALTKRDTVSSRKGKRATISARSHDVSDLILEHFLCPGRNLIPRCKGLGRFYDSLFRRAAGLEDPLEWVFMFFFVLSFHFPSSSCLPSRWDRSFPLPAMYATTKVRTALTRTTTSEDRLFGVRSTTGGPTTQKPVFSRTRLPRFACASLWDGSARAVERNLGAFGKILRCDFFNVVAHKPRFTYARGRVKSGSLCLCYGVGGVL